MDEYFLGLGSEYKSRRKIIKVRRIQIIVIGSFLIKRHIDICTFKCLEMNSSIPTLSQSDDTDDLRRNP